MKKITKDIVAEMVGTLIPVPFVKLILQHLLDKWAPPDPLDPNTLLAHALRGNPKAQETLVKALYGLAQTLMETSDEEKKAALRAAANSYMQTPTALDGDPANTYQSIMVDTYLRWVREMNHIHIRFLSAGHLDEVRKVATAITGGRSSPYGDQWDRIDAGPLGPFEGASAAPPVVVVENCWDDLLAKNLVRLPSKYIFREAKLTDLGMDKDLRTPTAIEFLNYVGIRAQRSPREKRAPADSP